MSLRTGLWNLELFTRMPLLHLLPCSLLDTPPKPSPLLDVRVHMSAIMANLFHASSCLYPPGAVFVFPSPSSSSSCSRRPEPSRAVVGALPAAPRRPASIQLATTLFALLSTYAAPH